MSDRTARSKSEMRRHRRQPLTYGATVFFDDAIPLPCALRDVSESGARLTFEEEPDVPDRFTLLLSTTGSTQRKCRVAWRAGKEVGVEFVKAPAA